MRTFVTALAVAYVAANACAQVGAEWEGEWGNFTQIASASGASSLGHGISISGCKADKCDFSVMVEEKADHGGASGYVEIQSATQAIAHLITALKEEHCSLELELISDGQMIKARPHSGDCTYFLTPGASFEHEYPLHSRDYYVGNDIAACFASSAATLHAVCTNRGLTDQVQNWELLYLRVSELEAQLNELARAHTAREHILAVCDHASDVERCLRDGFARSSLQLEARQRAWLASITEAGAPAEAEAKASAMKGSYRHSFPNSDVDGDHFTSTDTLDIAPLPDHAIRFSADLQFYNGHECSIDGVAKFAKAGFFVFQDKANNAGPLGCVLEIIPDKDGVRLSDPTGGCKMISCGERGGYSGAAFTFKDRR